MYRAALRAVLSVGLARLCAHVLWDTVVLMLHAVLNADSLHLLFFPRHRQCHDMTTPIPGRGDTVRERWFKRVARGQAVEPEAITQSSFTFHCSLGRPRPIPSSALFSVAPRRETLYVPERVLGESKRAGYEVGECGGFWAEVLRAMVEASVPARPGGCLSS